MTQKASEMTDGMMVEGYARLLRKRNQGGVIFFTVRYGEMITQLLFDRNETEKFDVAKSMSLGSLASFIGEVRTMRTGAKAILVRRFSIVCMNLQGMPDKWHGLSDDTRYRNRAVDLMTNQVAFEFAAFISASTFGIRLAMASHGYREFNTGTLQERFEGGLAQAFSTEAKFNGRTYYLSLTSELKLKRLILGGFERVFEIAQTFRNEGVNAICSPEHTILEAYAVGSTLEEQIGLVEGLVKDVACLREEDGLVGFRDRADALHTLDFKSKFKSITFAEACVEYTGYSAHQLSLEHLIQIHPNLFSEGMARYTWLMKFIELVLAPHMLQPTFLTHLPMGMSPFVKASGTHSGFSERAFFICGGLFIADVYVDENNPAVLIPALRTQAEAEEGVFNEDFIKLIEYGLPPTAGFGLGLKRLALLFRRELPFSIKETILFPL